MPTHEIKTRFRLEGEQQFRAAMKDAADAQKVLNAEMKLAKATFENTGDAEEYAAESARILREQIREQQKAVDAAESALKKLGERTNQNKDSYDKWLTKYWNSKTQLVNLKNQFEHIGEAIKGADEKTNESGLKNGIDFHNTIEAIDGITGAIESVIKTAFRASKALWDMGVDAGKWAKEITTNSQRFGLDPATYQSWQVAAQVIGFSLDDIKGAWDALDNKLTQDQSGDQFREFNEQLSKLHVGLRDSSGHLKTSKDLFWDVADALRAMGSEAEYGKTASQLLGGNWRNLIPLIERGSLSFHALALEGKQTATVSNENVKELAEFGDKANKVGTQLNTLKYDTLAALAPTFNQVAEAMSKAISALDEFVKSEEGRAALEGLNEAVSGLINSFLGDDNGKETFAGIVNTAKEAVSGFTTAMSWIEEHGGSIAGIIGSMAAAWAGLKVVKGAMEVFQIGKAGFNAGKSIFDGGKNLFSRLFGAKSASAESLDDVAKSFSDTADRFSSAADAFDSAADSAKSSAEAAKSSSEAAKTASESASSASEAASSSSEAASSASGTAKSASDAATNSENAAATSKEAAKGSASAAKSASETAEKTAEAASSAAEAATSSKEGATSSADAAGKSSEAASSSKEVAATSAEAANSSADAAANSKDAAKGSKEAAKASAGASWESAKSSVFSAASAQSSKNAASASKDAAMLSAGASWDSAISAASSASSAIESAAGAATSRALLEEQLAGAAAARTLAETAAAKAVASANASALGAGSTPLLLTGGAAGGTPALPAGPEPSSAAAGTAVSRKSWLESLFAGLGNGSTLTTVAPVGSLLNWANENIKQDQAMLEEAAARLKKQNEEAASTDLQVLEEQVNLNQEVAAAQDERAKSMERLAAAQAYWDALRDPDADVDDVLNKYEALKETFRGEDWNEFNKLKEKIEDLKWDNLENLDEIKDLPSEWFGVGEDAAAGLKSGLENGQEDVEEASKALGDATAAAAMAALDEHSPSKVMETIGGNASVGLANGIYARADEAIRAAQWLADQVAATFKAALDIHSPSGVFEAFGEFTALGYAGGLEKSISAVERAVGHMTAAATRRPVRAIGGLSMAAWDGSAPGSPRYGSAAPSEMLHLTIDLDGDNVADVMAPLINGKIGAMVQATRRN